MTVVEQTRACATCGADITGSHGKRRFCSDRCRKAQYAGQCAECGATLSGTNGRGPNAPTICVRCAAARGRAAQAVRADARWSAMAAMWRDGAKLREIADAFGISMNNMHKQLQLLRQHGYDMPYRYGPDRRGALHSARVRAALGTVASEKTHLSREAE